MIERRVALWLDDDSGRPAWRAEPDTPSYPFRGAAVLCPDAIRELVRLPRRCKHADLVLSDTPDKNAFHIKVIDRHAVLVDGKPYSIYSRFGMLVQSFKETHGVDDVYVSLEYTTNTGA